MALSISHDYVSAIPFKSIGIMLDQDKYNVAKSSQIEHDMEVEKQGASNIISTG